MVFKCKIQQKTRTKNSEPKTVRYFLHVNRFWFNTKHIEIADDNIVNPNHKIFKKNSVYLQKNFKDLCP